MSENSRQITNQNKHNNMKLVEYKCQCGKSQEELFNDTEQVPEYIECSCGDKASKSNFKNNCQRWRYCDS